MSSKFRIANTCLEWYVELPSIDSPRESPVFFIKNNECLLRFVVEEKTYWWCILYLDLKSKHAEPCHCELEVGFKSECTLSLGKKDLSISQSSRRDIWYIRTEDFQKKLPSDYMTGNWIKFVFRIEEVDVSLLKINKEINDKSVQTPQYIDTNTLLEGVSNDFCTLLDEGLNHDVEFMCGDVIIKAHKNILCCRSKVFTSMLQIDMVEGKTGHVKIQDMEVTIFKEFLRYLYTGVLPELTADVALRFYEASDKYAMDVLKKQCTSFLLENLPLENVCEVLIIADRHNDPEFKKYVMEYMIQEKIPRIGENWAEFCKENPVLAIEVLNLFIQRSC